MVRSLFAAFVCAAVAAAAIAQTSADDTPFPEDPQQLLYGHAKTPPAPQTLTLGPAPHLFIDDYLIESSENLVRAVIPPQRDPEIPNPVVTGKEDGCFQPYLTVLRDEATGRFRMWYGRHTAAMDSNRSKLGYIESADGIHWERPARTLEEPAPIQFGVSVVDTGASAVRSAQRYIYAWHMEGWLSLAGSPDGLNWLLLDPSRVINHSHDISGLYFDPIRRRFLATVSVYRKAYDWPGPRRVTLHSHSRDLKRWSVPHFVLVPAVGIDEGETQFYAMDGYLARGPLLIGMVKVLRDDLKADDPPEPHDAYGIGYTTLAWTRDGVHWLRDTAHFFDPNPQKGAWDHAHAWIDEQVVVGDQVYLYYGGYARGHKVNRFEERQIGLLRITLDRYVAREAGEVEGVLRTVPFTFNGGRLTLNVDADAGLVRAQVLEADGGVIDGFAYEDCRPVREDGVRVPLAWAEDVGRLRGRVVRIEFRVRNARLFGFGVE